MDAASQPDDPILIPLGQPLGNVLQPDGATRYEVRLGATVVHLESEDARLWSALHQTRPGAARGLSRAEATRLDIGPGVEPSWRLDALLADGLVVELDLRDDQAVADAGRRFRLLPLHVCVGNSEQSPDSYTMRAGGVPSVSVDAVTLDVLASGPPEACRADCTDVLSGALGVDPDHAELGDPTELTRHVLRRVHGLLAAHAAYLDLAVVLDYDLHPELPRPQRVDPASVIVPEGDRTEYGTYSVGYQLGAVYFALGLRHVRLRIGRTVHTWPDVDSSLVWGAAGGVLVGNRLTDDADAARAVAEAAGARRVRYHRDLMTAAGVIQQPDGAELVAIAAAHRVEPLLAGLGHAASDPDRFVLGTRDGQAVVELSASDHEVWRLAHLEESILDAAAAQRRARTIEDLFDYMRSVQRLWFYGAAYIDRVRRP